MRATDGAEGRSKYLAALRPNIGRSGGQRLSLKADIRLCQNALFTVLPNDRLRILQRCPIVYVAPVKRATRYWQDPHFRAAVSREKGRAKLEGEQKGWICGPATSAVHHGTDRLRLTQPFGFA